MARQQQMPIAQVARNAWLTPMKARPKMMRKASPWFAQNRNVPVTWLNANVTAQMAFSARPSSQELLPFVSAKPESAQPQYRLLQHLILTA
jgi:hypothetical protein